METELSPKQKLLLNVIKDYRRKNGSSPTLNTLREMLGVRFINSVVHLLDRLEEKGYIQRSRGTQGGIVPIGDEHQTVNIPVVGAVACGMPLLAQENIEGYISTDKKFVKDDPKKYFFLRATGDSMDLAGIHDGDMVLVHSQSTAKPEDRVIALIDEEATIKFVRPGDGYVALVPKSSNPANKPIILHNDFTIQGIVRAVYKKEMLQA